MSTNRITDANSVERFGAYLKDRRARLDPVAFGFSTSRRRTPGLRREEVAQRANISTTWYTWLEQGRGGAPSADVLERIVRALMLTETEREHLFLLGLGRPPEARYQQSEGVTPRLQRVLDALDVTPAVIRTATWDILAWNRGANVLMPGIAKLPPRDRNLLRFTFLDPRAQTIHPSWDSMARFIVSAFRLDTARAGASAKASPMIDELCRRSPEFANLWQENELPSPGLNVIRQFRHPHLGTLSLEHSAFAVDGRTDLLLSVYTPMSADDAARIAAAVRSG